MADQANPVEVEREKDPMVDQANPVEVERENQPAVVVVNQPRKTSGPRFFQGTLFGLPSNWMVEERPRKASSKYSGKKDQFFYEPGTEKQFRSLKAAKKHLGLDVGQSSRKRKPKASKSTDQTENLKEKDKFASKATGRNLFHYLDQNLNEKDKFASKAADQYENVKDKFVSKAADQSEVIFRITGTNFDENDKIGSSSKVAEENVDKNDEIGSSNKATEEDKGEENYHYFDKITKRVRLQLVNDKENSWDRYVKVPDAVQERWMDMFLRPNNYNQESNPPKMK